MHAVEDQAALAGHVHARILVWPDKFGVILQEFTSPPG
jgi:hypothetical protein